MKKKLTPIFFTLILALVISCNKEKDLAIEQTESIAELKSDSRLSKLIEINMSITSKVVNKNKAIMLLNKDKLSESELNELSVSLGFKNSLEYQNIIFQQSILSKELVNDYNLKNQKKDFINKIILESPIIKDQKKKIMIFGTNCERIRRNCLLEVAATAAGMHIACASLADWTGFGAPICHGAAIIYQLAAGDNCNANAEDCKG